jgi:hypothetical protein
MATTRAAPGYRLRPRACSIKGTIQIWAQIQASAFFCSAGRLAALRAGLNTALMDREEGAWGQYIQFSRESSRPVSDKDRRCLLRAKVSVGHFARRIDPFKRLSAKSGSQSRGLIKSAAEFVPFGSVRLGIAIGGYPFKFRFGKKGGLDEQSINLGYRGGRVHRGEFCGVPEKGRAQPDSRGRREAA